MPAITTAATTTATRSAICERSPSHSRDDGAPGTSAAGAGFGGAGDGGGGLPAARAAAAPVAAGASGEIGGSGALLFGPAGGDALAFTEAASEPEPDRSRERENEPGRSIAGERVDCSTRAAAAPSMMAVTSG